MKITVKGIKKDNKMLVKYSFDNGKTINKILTKEQYVKEFKKTDEYLHLLIAKRTTYGLNI